MRIIGAILILVGAILAYYVHGLYPPKHDKPEDFNKLITEGPYKYIRHPFYAAFIIMGFGIALFLLSISGMIFGLILYIMFLKLAIIEERELLDYWGDEYRRFMESRPRFFPKISRKRFEEDRD